MQNIELESVKINLTRCWSRLQTNFMAYFREKKLLVMWMWKRIWKFTVIRTSLPVSLIIILRNAIAYCYENTKIEIQARMKNNKIEITFTNSGDRIPGDMLQTILKNFTG